MGTRMSKALLIGENAQGSSYLAKRLQGRGLECSFARSYEEASSLLRAQTFGLALSPMRLRDGSLFPLIGLLHGSDITLFYYYAVEDGCLWLPALRHGERCFGSSAFRPSEFVVALDQAIEEILFERQASDNAQQSPSCQPSTSIFVVNSSRQQLSSAEPARPRRPVHDPARPSTTVLSAARSILSATLP